MAKHKFSLRKLRQIGKTFELELINAADPSELFSALLNTVKEGALDHKNFSDSDGHFQDRQK